VSIEAVYVNICRTANSADLSYSRLGEKRKTFWLCG